MLHTCCAHIHYRQHIGGNYLLNYSGEGEGEGGRGEGEGGRGEGGGGFNMEDAVVAACGAVIEATCMILH